MHTHPYPHLPPELRRLSGDALQLWGNADARRQALHDVLAAWENADEAELARTGARIDGAVVAGLDALSLARDPRATVQIGNFGRAWIGHVADDLTIQVDITQVRHYVHAERQPDRVFHTWIHESLHARALPSPSSSAMFMWRGFEEGMVEGLARTVTGAAGIAVADPSYSFYVEAYRALAAAGGFSVERLWRRLWLVRPGGVREHFAAVMDGVRREYGLPAIGAAQRSRLQAVGDRVFAWGRAGDRANAALLIRLWESALQ